ncbi:uncharacterized protein ARMOST_12290 [Armillaria ostoyae]|uniref:Uncharacterized protein n=1 Tax=Armillaria ostoyae TaxID=47428 RepID=A0A284RJG9_ARMOS|nr:uncharacterized protein ARMOST_12290 [Armillaria ostoyae]
MLWMPDHLLGASFETFIGFEDGWVACTGPKANSYCFSMNVDLSYVYDGSLVSAQRRPSRCELDALLIPVAADLIELFLRRC